MQGFQVTYSYTLIEMCISTLKRGLCNYWKVTLVDLLLYFARRTFLLKAQHCQPAYLGFTCPGTSIPCWKKLGESLFHARH